MEPPEENDLPKKNISCIWLFHYPWKSWSDPAEFISFPNCTKLKTDYINMGFAGCALMEEEMAEYLVSRKDWDFASVEMGINAVGTVKDHGLFEFEKRIDRFTQILSEIRARYLLPLFLNLMVKIRNWHSKCGLLYKNMPWND